MKLLIDVSEEDYKECIFRKDLLSLGGEPTDLTFNMRMEKLIANGIPLEEELEEIKADVINIADGRQSIKVKSVRNIIDKRVAKLKGE